MDQLDRVKLVAQANFFRYDSKHQPIEMAMCTIEDFPQTTLMTVDQRDREMNEQDFRVNQFMSRKFHLIPLDFIGSFTLEEAQRILLNFYKKHGRGALVGCKGVEETRLFESFGFPTVNLEDIDPTIPPYTRLPRCDEKIRPRILHDFETHQNSNHFYCSSTRVQTFAHYLNALKKKNKMTSKC